MHEKNREKTGRKHPDRLSDSCKPSSVNLMAAGSKLSWLVHHGFFLLFATFQTYFPELNVFSRL